MSAARRRDSLPVPRPALIAKVVALDAASVRRLKSALFAAGLGPLGFLVWLGFSGNLGADPVEFVRRSTGTWTLDFLIITLAVTPLRKLTGWHWLVRLRRMFGLYAFFYALIHVVTYLWLDQLFDAAEIWRDIVKRPMIAAGFLSFVLMIPLAITSTDRMVRRLGGKRWQLLHRAVYVIAIAGVIHFWWLVKVDFTRPLIYSAIIGGLLAARIVSGFRKRGRDASGRVQAATAARVTSAVRVRQP